MSTTTSETPGGGGPDQMTSAIFANLVMQNTHMAMIFLGLQPHPQSGQTEQDLDHARFFIDQLEMLAVKTKGNLDKQEDALLKQSLTHLRLSFVEAVKEPAKPAVPEPSPPATPPTDEQETPVTEASPPGETPAESESRKKFTKKY